MAPGVRRFIGSAAARPGPSSSPATAWPRARWRRPCSSGASVKVYLALASGTSMPDAFTVDAPIGPVPYRLPATVNAYHPGGRPSMSHVRVLRRFPDTNAALLEVTIPTGRPHQIRIHLAFAGFPLVGDPLYRVGRNASDGRRRRRIDDAPGRVRLSPALLEDRLSPSCPGRRRRGRLPSASGARSGCGLGYEIAGGPKRGSRYRGRGRAVLAPGPHRGRRSGNGRRSSGMYPLCSRAGRRIRPWRVFPVPGNGNNGCSA